MILLLELGLVFFHLLAWVAVGHALLTKRDPRSALGWSVVVLFMPVVGVIAYAIFGIGRTESRAAAIMRHNAALAPGYTHPALGTKVPEQIPEQIRHMEMLGRHLTQQHLCGGNSIEPLVNGNEAYPAMLEAIRRAKDHVYLLTYIFNSGEVADSFAEELTAAVQRGVDVRIYTPGVPDKKTIYQLSRSYFPHLLKAGVKIYSYTPGFLHAKTWLIDDRAAAVGTVNLDYRSLYLHFENSTVLYGGEVLSDIRRDLDGIESVSRRLGPDDCRNGFLGNMLSACLRLVAPLC